MFFLISIPLLLALMLATFVGSIYVGELVGYETVQATVIWSLVVFPGFVFMATMGDLVSRYIHVIHQKTNLPGRSTDIVISDSTKRIIRKSKIVNVVLIIIYYVFVMPIVQHYGWLALLSHAALYFVMFSHDYTSAKLCITGIPAKKIIKKQSAEVLLVNKIAAEQRLNTKANK